MKYVRYAYFSNCSQCGRSWKIKHKGTFSDGEIVSLVKATKWMCNRCGDRDLLINLRVNAGKKPDIEEIDKQVKQKYGY